MWDWVRGGDVQNLWKRDTKNEDNLTSWTVPDDWDKQGCEDGGWVTSGDLLGENVTSVPIPGSFIRLLVSRADCCSEAGSVVRQGWEFSRLRRWSGESPFWPGLGGWVQHRLEYIALWGPHLHSSLHLHCGYLVPFLKTTNVTSLLCILSEWFYADEKLNVDIKYFNTTINKLDLIEIRGLLHQQLQNTHFTPFKDPWNTYTNWSILGHETKLNKFQRVVIIENNSLITLWLC